MPVFIEVAIFLARCSFSGSCNITKIPITTEKKEFGKEILATNSMKEPEDLYLRSLTNDSYVSCNEEGGSLTIFRNQKKYLVAVVE